jgi:hypothetical protein
MVTAANTESPATTCPKTRTLGQVYEKRDFGDPVCSMYHNLASVPEPNRHTPSTHSPL